MLPAVQSTPGTSFCSTSARLVYVGSPMSIESVWPFVYTPTSDSLPGAGAPKAFVGTNASVAAVSAQMVAAAAVLLLVIGDIAHPLHRGTDDSGSPHTDG